MISMTTARGPGRRSPMVYARATIATAVAAAIGSRPWTSASTSPRWTVSPGAAFSDDAHRRVDLCALPFPAGSQLQTGLGDGAGVDGLHPAVRLGRHGRMDRRLGELQRGAHGRSSLCRHPAPEAGQGAAVVQGGQRPPLRGRPLREAAGQQQQLAGQHAHQFPQVGRALALQAADRLLHLEGIPHGASQRLVHRRDDAGHRQTGAASQPSHRFRRATGGVHLVEEGPLPHGDVQHQSGGAGGDLLAHDAGRDQAFLVDGGGGVAERIEETVGRHQVLRLTGHGDAHPFPPGRAAARPTGPP